MVQQQRQDPLHLLHSDSHAQRTSKAISNPSSSPMREYPSVEDLPVSSVARPNITSNGGPLGFAASGPSSMSMRRHPGYQPPLLPLRESPLAPKTESRLKLDLSMSDLPGKTRKRHKVATSCNRCRQNKRKCDSAIPCSNCRRNKAACLYTDAQQSRSTWGDSPLSKEKVVGVLIADRGNPPSAATDSPTPTSAAPPASPSPLKPSTKPPGASSGSKAALAFSGTAALTPTASSSAATLLFNPGHVSTEQSTILDRRKEMMAQSKQIAKAIRVARPGPQLNLSDVLPNETMPGMESAAIRHRQSVSHASVTSAATPARPLPFSATNMPNQSESRPVFHQQDSGIGGQLASPLEQNQHSFQAQQHQQAGLDGVFISNRSQSIRPVSPYSDPSTSQQQLSPFRESEDQIQSPLGLSHQSGDLALSPLQRLTLSYPDGAAADFAGFSAFMPDQGNLDLISHGFQNGGQSSGLQFSPYEQQNISGGASSENNGVPSQQQSVYSQQQQHFAMQQQQQYSGHQHPIIGSNVAGVSAYRQQHYSQVVLARDTPDLNHAIGSAAPVSSIASASHFSQPDSWSASSHQPREQTEWKDTNMSQQTAQISVAVTAAPSTVVGSSIGYPGSFPAASSIQSAPAQTEERTDTMRMWKIAKDMFDCKKYDYSIMLPRHISQDYDELWVAPHSTTPCDLQGIPRQLLMVPKDANFLVDVFFENSYFYYPVVNRAVVETHLMDPQTPQALLILNVIFMTACKHLGRHTDIKRAIQFRERAREIQQYIDGKVRLSSMQAHLLGSQVVYGVFVVVIGMAQICGTYQPLPTTDSLYDENNPTIDLAAESRSIIANKGVIPEAAYQQRLWAFWGYYARDAMSRLYFGWPYGLDSAIVTAELPKIKGCVGLGGTRKNLTGQTGSGEPVTGKRRGPTMKKKQIQREKKVLRAEAMALQGSRDAYRMTTSISDDDDDDEDGPQEQGDESDLEQEEFAAVNDHSMDKKDAAENDKQHKRSVGAGASRNNTESDTSAPSIDGKASLSGLSRNLLERQSRGEDIGRRQNSHGSGSGTNPIEVRRHLDRMKVLLGAESDVTDGGSYTRILFLEEIKLWSIGRRVGLYLQGRSTSMSVSPAAAATGSYSPNHKQGSVTDSRNIFGSTISATLEASRCSESAWLEDRELQGLQADLIAWEQALPPMFQFRQDVESPDINHKVNGKLGILTMYYYTITIMLQSSYLPIPQYLKSSSRSSTLKSPEPLSQEHDGMFSRCVSQSLSEESSGGGPRIKSEADDYLLTGRSPQPSNGYFNTAHQISTQLSNVLFHHVELMLDSYPNWCVIQCKLNQTLAAALRVSCLNARLGSNSKAIRDEAKAGFKMGSDLFKRQALLPDPLTVRDWPAEEDVQVMLDLEEEFRELMTTQDEELAMAEARSRGHTGDGGEGQGNEDPGDHLLYVPDYQDGAIVVPLNDNGLPLDGISQQYDFFRAEHVFGLSEEGFQFDYSIDV